ncbi:LysM peptidoglycan-binding domain-containing protein [Companilactobacillus mishanensis]|uniref:LysM peptidoglycan-binding domain-containing protein n=1 Tax=Companilactobacillus mishanensis TaxID=2486008 RepID=A0A5P0ZKX6_9LACO|nr:LysM peptidoglycan-binding domain-containing protein [Companilactobacillus mishanensis]MQS53635.1 LysM peptidoglycan-binding domain-containing protein [Companilactobacillus mishanensis]MQS90249.1 LysM peptidoglycan-binding domain-containing protein [Companilactobacillus mishanensis]
MKKVLSIAFVSAIALTAFGVNTSNSEAATTKDSNHVSVVAGDTYKSIAAENNVSISDLEQANGREVGGFDIIYPGETITLPTNNAVQQNVQTTSTATTQSVATPASTGTTTSKGTFKVSFYDPAVLGSGMGYSGVAANLSVFPKGTQLKITLSNGQVMYRTVNDTGTFAYSNSQQLDVAMPSSSIPSYGVTSASVEVIG